MKQEDDFVFPDIRDGRMRKGITLRDFFAAVALAAKLDQLDGIDDANFERARNAYAQADAMLEVRKGIQ